MLVVADTSPLSVLAEIDCLAVLPSLFGQVVIPPQVAAELSHSKAPGRAKDLVANLPGWLQIRHPQRVQPIPPLDPGEEAAINLARECGADLLLMDDKEGRIAAEQLGLRVIGAVGVLEEAADADLLDLNDAFRKIRHARFFVSEAVLDDSLRRHARKHPPGA